MLHALRPPSAPLSPSVASAAYSIPAPSPDPKDEMERDKEKQEREKERHEKEKEQNTAAKKRKMPIINPLVSLPMWPSKLILDLTPTSD